METACRMIVNPIPPVVLGVISALVSLRCGSALLTLNLLTLAPLVTVGCFVWVLCMLCVVLRRPSRSATPMI